MSVSFVPTPLSRNSSLKFGHYFQVRMYGSNTSKYPPLPVEGDSFMKKTAEQMARIAPYYARVEAAQQEMSSQYQAYQAVLKGKEPKEVPVKLSQKSDPLFFILGNRGLLLGAFVDELNEAMQTVSKSEGLGVYNGSDVKQGVEIYEYRKHHSPEKLAEEQQSIMNRFAETYQSLVVDLLGERMPNEPYTEPKGYVVTYGGDILKIGA